MTVRRLCRSAWQCCKYSVLALLLLVALLSVTLRLFVNQLPEYKSTLETLMSERSGYSVQIESVSGGWGPLVGKLHLSGITLSDPERGPVLEIAAADMQLHLLASLMQGRVVFKRIYLDKLVLALSRDSKGRWQLQSSAAATELDQRIALTDEAASRAVTELLGLLLTQREIHLSNSLLRIDLGEGRQLPVHEFNVHLQQRGRDNLIRGDIRLLGSKRTALAFLAQSRGAVEEPAFNGRFYLHVPPASQTYWLAALPAFNGTVNSLSAGAELWGSWQGSHLKHLRGDLSLSELDWHHDAARLDLRDVAAQLQLLRADTGYELQLDELRGKVQGLALPLARLHLGRDADSWSLLTDQVDIGALSAMLETLSVVPAPLRNALGEMQPHGQLRNLRLRWRDQPDEIGQHLALMADMQALGVAARDGVPEMRGVSGRLALGEREGRIDVSTQGFFLNFPELYAQGWQFDAASGVVRWSVTDDGVDVVGERLRMRNAGLQASGGFALHASPNAPSDSSLTLMIGLENSDAALTTTLVPDKVVSSDLFRWLSEAALQGQVRAGGFLFHGPLDENEGPASIQLFVDAEQAAVRYHPDWPALSAVQARTLLKDSSLLVEAHAGQAYATQIGGARIAWSDSAPLSVMATLQGPAADGRRVLLESPVADALGEAFAEWQLADGAASTDLDLSLDLDRPDRSQIRVRSTLRDVHYFSPSLNLDFAALNGTLTFTDTQGLHAAHISARFLDQAVTAQIHSNAAGTRVTLAGPIEMRRLNRWLDLPVLSLLSGTTDYRAELALCQAVPGCGGLTVNSDLHGVAADLPFPLRKAPDDRRAFTLSLPLSGGSGEGTPWLDLSYGANLRLLLSLQDAQVTGGDILLGPGVEPRWRGDGFTIRGQLDYAHAGQWQSLLNRLFSAQPSTQASTQASAQPSTQASTQQRLARHLRIPPLLESVGLSVQRLDLYGQALDQVHLDLMQQENVTLLQVDSHQFQAVLHVPSQGGAPAKLEIARLALQHAAEPSVPAEQTAPSPYVPQQDLLAAIDPEAVPALKVALQALFVNNKHYGQWHFQLRPAVGGVDIADIHGDLPGLSALADVQWRQRGAPTGQETHMTFSLLSPQLGDTLQAWDQGRVVEADYASLKGDLVWPGSPLGFSLAALEGEIDVLIKDGRIPEAGTAGGSLRLFGLLNMEAIGRRLRLDFSDMLSKGLSFDRLGGSYALRQGIAQSLAPTEFEGPSAEIQIQGQINLLDRRLEQTMAVTLPIGGNLPLAAILLATPQVAGAVFLVEKLIGKQLKKFTTVRYRVHGPWENPIVEPLVAARLPAAFDDPIVEQ